MSTVEIPAQTEFTPDDLLTMPDGDSYELVDGQLVERKMGAESSWISGRIFGLIDRWNESGPVDEQGWAFPEGTSLQCFVGRKVRRADASFFKAGRIKGNFPRGHLPIAPNLAVEVISPRDIYEEVEQKVQEYLDAGVELIWLISPRDRTVKIYRQGGRDPQRLTVDDELTGEDVLPGFRCQVADLFPSRKT